jgi:peptidoglycan/LPS O-acetylase OafA/YrhL
MSHAFPAQSPASAQNGPASQFAEIKSLTGLRGLAAFYVILFHASAHMRFEASVLPFVRHGYIMVDLFFILSGYVMALTYGPFFDKVLNFKNYARFLLIRFTRIWPLYALLTLIAGLLIAFWFGKSYYYEDLSRAIIPNVTMSQIWGLANSIDRPSWSVSAEWTAYLVFPLFYLMTLKPKPAVALMWGAVGFGVLLFIAYGPTWVAERPFDKRNGPLDIVSSYAWGTTLRCLGDFVLGMIAFRFRRFVDLSFAPWLLLGTLLLLCLKGTDMLLIAFFMGLIMSLTRDVGPIAQILSFRPFYWMGVVSYAVYLVHDLVLHLIFRALLKMGIAIMGPKSLWLMAALALTYGLAALFYYGFEKPSRHGLKVWVSKISF